MTHPVPLREGTSRQRNTGIDAARYLLSFLVVLLHSLPRAGVQPPWCFAIDMGCRAAVPFFLIASGYFMPLAATFSAKAVTKPLRRLLPVYLFWLAVYFVFFRVTHIATWEPRAQDIINGGTAFHLWFLPALGLALALVGCGNPLLGTRLTGAICAAIAVLAIARSSYHDALGLAGTATRGGILIAPMYVYLGTWFARHDVRVGWTAIVSLLILGYALLFGEEVLIMHLAHFRTLFSHDFTFATFPIGAAAFLGARATRAPEWLARAGAISLSVYASHILFLWSLRPVIGNATVVQAVALAIVSFVLASALAWCLQWVPGIRRLVR